MSEAQVKAVLDSLMDTVKAKLSGHVLAQMAVGAVQSIVDAQFETIYALAVAKLAAAGL